MTAATLPAEQAAGAMKSDIHLVVWDIDRVWYPDISTTYAARGSRQGYEPYLQEAYTNGWVNPEQVAMWESVMSRKLGTSGNEYVGALADMYTDLFYGVKEGDEVIIPKGTIIKDQIIKGKQALLRGLTLGDVKRVADSVAYTEGLEEVVRTLRRSLVVQAGFSDGLGPFVAYKMLQQGILVRGIVPAVIEYRGVSIYRGQEIRFTRGSAEYWLTNDTFPERDNATLTGWTLPFDKSHEIFHFIGNYDHTLESTAAIDDSAANIETLRRIREGGGVAIGFNVNDRRKFEEAKIPVIKGDNLGPFGEIVRDRRRIREYCETWGVEV